MNESLHCTFRLRLGGSSVDAKVLMRHLLSASSCLQETTLQTIYQLQNKGNAPKNFEHSPCAFRALSTSFLQQVKTESQIHHKRSMHACFLFTGADPFGTRSYLTLHAVEDQSGEHRPGVSCRVDSQNVENNEVSETSLFVNVLIVCNLCTVLCSLARHLTGYGG